MSPNQIGFVLLILVVPGCVGAPKYGSTPLGQPLSSKTGRGVGGPSDSDSVISMIKDKTDKKNKGPMSWTSPISNGFQKLTDPLMTRSKRSGSPRDQLSLDIEARPNADLYLGTAEYAASMGKFEEARSMLEKAMEETPRPDVKISLARIAVRQKDYEYAEKLYKELLKENASSPVLHNDLGMLYDQMDDPQRCYDHFRQAISLAPDNERYRNNLAARLVKDQRLDEARGILVRQSDEPTADLTISALLQQHGQVELAAEYWRSAQQAMPRVAPDHPLQAYFQRAGGQVRTAQQDSPPAEQR